MSDACVIELIFRNEEGATSRLAPFVGQGKGREKCNSRHEKHRVAGNMALNAARASHTDATYTDGRSIKMDLSCSYAKRRHNSSGGSFVPSIEIT